LFSDGLYLFIFYLFFQVIYAGGLTPSFTAAATATGSGLDGRRGGRTHGGCDPFMI
jgi:hypothetical protein